LDYLHTKLLRLSDDDRRKIDDLRGPFAACVRVSSDLKAELLATADTVFKPLFDRGALITQNAQKALSEGRTIVAEALEIDTFFINDLSALPSDRVFVAHSDSIAPTERNLQQAAIDFFAKRLIAPYISAQNTAPNTLLIRLKGIKARSLVQALKLDEIAITNGEGCSLDLFTPSFVVQSYGYSEDMAREAISLSWAADIDEKTLFGTFDKLIFRYRQIRRLFP
jgi:hypothetical protein